MDQREIGRFISALRREKGLTQAELGARLGVTNKTVSRWENGNHMPDLSLLLPLGEELGVGVNELLSGRRLEEGEFRRQAEHNMASVLEGQKRLLRRKKLSDALTYAGIGLLLSTVYALYTPERTAVAVAAIAAIGVGGLLRAGLDRFFLQDGAEGKNQSG